MEAHDQSQHNSLPSTAGTKMLDKAEISSDLQSLQNQMEELLAVTKAHASYSSKSREELEHQVSVLEQKLNAMTQERNYWRRQCEELTQKHEKSIEKELQCVKSRPRRRTNSELLLLTTALGSTRKSMTSSTVDEGSSESSSSSNGDDVNISRSSFRLLQCSDEQCEVFTPMHRSIQTRHRSQNNVQFMWEEAPSRVLIVKKPNVHRVTNQLIRIANWFVQEKGMSVVVEPQVDNEVKGRVDGVETWEGEREWKEMQMSIDFVVSLGGDGTVLWVSQLFNENAPPILSFAMGSLGFLTPFAIEDDVQHLTGMIEGGFNLTLRSRLVGEVYRSNGDQVSLLETNHALNEIVIDRGPSGALVDLTCYCDGLEVTKIAADGIILATPTGSTAYSLSAGGSITHPSVPTMLFTPICPHTLSFRPLLFHDSATLKIEFPLTSRAESAYVSFDGKKRVLLYRGDYVLVKVSSYPLPSVCRVDENQDWFDSISTNLSWNQRRQQKPWSLEGEYVREE